MISLQSKIQNHHSSFINSSYVRHAFAKHLSLGGTDIRTLQELLGHADVKTTEIYAHVAKGVNGKGVRSPLDALGAAV